MNNSWPRVRKRKGRHITGGFLMPQYTVLVNTGGMNNSITDLTFVSDTQSKTSNGMKRKMRADQIKKAMETMGQVAEKVQKTCDASMS